MFYSESGNLQKIEWIKPRAFMTSRLSPVKLIVELPNGKYTFLLPPFYEIEEITERYAYEAAVSKYGYEPVEGEHVLHGREDLKMFVKRFE